MKKIRFTPFFSRLTAPYLIRIGLHLGIQRSRNNASMAPYLIGERNIISIFDLSKTIPSIKRALYFSKEYKKLKATSIILAPELEPLLQLEESNSPIRLLNWNGGALTNKRLRKRLFPSLYGARKVKYRTKYRTKFGNRIYKPAKQKLYLKPGERPKKKPKRFSRLIKLFRPFLLTCLHRKGSSDALLESVRLKTPAISFCTAEFSPRLEIYNIPSSTETRSSIVLIDELIRRVNFVKKKKRRRKFNKIIPRSGIEPPQ